MAPAKKGAVWGGTDSSKGSALALRSKAAAIACAAAGLRNEVGNPRTAGVASAADTAGTAGKSSANGVPTTSGATDIAPQQLQGSAWEAPAALAKATTKPESKGSPSDQDGAHSTSADVADAAALQRKAPLGGRHIAHITPAKATGAATPERKGASEAHAAPGKDTDAAAPEREAAASEAHAAPDQATDAAAPERKATSSDGREACGFFYSPKVAPSGNAVTTQGDGSSASTGARDGTHASVLPSSCVATGGSDGSGSSPANVASTPMVCAGTPSEASTPARSLEESAVCAAPAATRSWGPKNGGATSSSVQLEMSEWPTMGAPRGHRGAAARPTPRATVQGATQAHASCASSAHPSRASAVAPTVVAIPRAASPAVSADVAAVPVLAPSEAPTESPETATAALEEAEPVGADEVIAPKENDKFSKTEANEKTEEIEEDVSWAARLKRSQGLDGATAPKSLGRRPKYAAPTPTAGTIGSSASTPHQRAVKVCLQASSPPERAAANPPPAPATLERMAL